MVSLCKQGVFVHILRAAGGLQFGGQAAAVVVDHFHAKTVEPAPRNSLPDAAHAQNAQRGAVDVAAAKHVVAPAGPESGAQEVLALGHAARGCHHQSKAEVRSGLGQHIRRVGALHAGGGHGGDVEVIETNCHVGANFELRAGLQQLGADALAAGRKSAILSLQALCELLRGPDIVLLVVNDVENRLQLRQHLREDGTADSYFGA